MLGFFTSQNSKVETDVYHPPVASSQNFYDKNNQRDAPI